eukprot:IDg1327t1
MYRYIGRNCSLSDFINQTSFPKMQKNTELALPVVDPASQPDSPNANGTPRSQRPRRRSCIKRLFGGHTVAEVGLSRWAPWWLLLLTRLASCGGILFLAILPTVVTPLLVSPSLEYISMYITALTYLLLAMSSVLAMRGWESNLFASILVPLHHFGSTTALLTGAFSLIFLLMNSFFLIPTLVYGGIPIALFLLDSFILQTQVRFRYGYMVIPIVAHIIAALITIIVYVTRVAFVISSSVWGLLLTFAILAGALVLASSVATLITHIDLTRCFRRNS